ncbi:MAG TPA: hypothetical protein VN704_12225 [Verrucomicrobiae bacterium]|nr:hypothetical protein [Verrucomicrobiae bacterium]
MGTGPNLFDIDFHDLPSKTKSDTNIPFNRRLNNLVKWNILIAETVLTIKGKARIFAISPFGKMLSSIIETILSANKKSSHDELFDSWKSHLSVNISSLDLFCMKYLEKCKEEELFEKFVDYYIKSFKYGKSRHIQSVNDLFTRMALVKLEDPMKNSILFDNWKKSFEKLDEETRKLFSHHIKLYIDRIILNEISDYSKYELKRFEAKDKSDQIIIPIRSSSCSNHIYTSMNIITFLSNYFSQRDNVYNIPVDRMCNECTYLVSFSKNMTGA